MHPTVRWFLLAMLLVIATGCAWGKNRSSARILEGDSSHIRYTDRESAGGRIGG